MKSDRGLFSKTASKIPKPVQTTNRSQKIAEAEKQLEILDNQDQIFKDESSFEKELRESEHYFTEEEDSQTNRKLSTMGDRKQMVVPGTRDAPKFSSSKPRELRRFLRQLEDLWKEAGIESDEEKKESLGKYADQESEEEWRALDAYSEGTWDDFKKEILENYPEASAAERGTPARIRQIVKEADGIELGETTKLYTYRRAFLAEASKLKKPPAVMSNRELVELFMGGLALPFGQAVLQYLGGNKRLARREKESVGKSSEKERRPEDRYDLEEVCKAAGEVSENAQGMLSYGWFPNQGSKRGSSLVQTPTPSASESSSVVTKLESLEETQALEKDRLDAVNKQWGARFDGLETMMKSLLDQTQEKPTASFVQTVGQGGGSFSHPEPMQNRGFRNSSNASGYSCFGCGESGHFQNDCERIKNLVRTGAIIYKDGRVCLPDGSKIPGIPLGANLADRVEKYYGNMRPTQAYYGSFEEMEDRMSGVLPRETSFMNREVEDREQKLAKLEKELELKERENALLAKQMKLEAKAPDKVDARSYFLDRFDEELKALQENKPGFL